MHDDIKNSLNEERKEEKRITYRYSESDLDETKVIPNLNKLPKEEVKSSKIDEVELEPKKDKKMNKVILIMSIIAAMLVVGLSVFLVIVPMFVKEKEIEIPDVSNLDIADAEKKLKDLGFEIATENKNEPSSTVKEGLVIETIPMKGLLRKEGTTITLVISSGEEGIVLENYIGKNYYEIKGKLEANGIKVTIEKKKIDDKEIKENTIIEQSPEVGTKVTKGDTVKLIIPDIVTKYPDFVGEGWRVEEIQSFCDENGITLTVVEEESNEPVGKVIRQSRSVDSPVATPGYLTITIAKEKVIDSPIEVPDIPNLDEEGN